MQYATVKIAKQVEARKRNAPLRAKQKAFQEAVKRYGEANDAARKAGTERPRWSDFVTPELEWWK